MRKQKDGAAWRSHMSARRSKMIAALAGVLVSGLTAVSCQTLNQAECQTASWYDLGQRDGLEGQPVTQVARHLEACGEYGLPVDNASWRRGWEAGIRQYCVPENGLNLGLSGSGQNSSCPADLAQAFMNAYAVGQRVHDARAERSRVEAELNDLNGKMVEAKSQEERSALSSQVFLKQNELLMSDRRVRDADWELDRYRNRSSAAGY
ncbi:DUF2799 domain-containing protein [Mesorhizobium sp. BAC0120]|nr:DUF2799 domain-containing protein [Mesorhizobium sp. BAC0120]